MGLSLVLYWSMMQYRRVFVTALWTMLTACGTAVTTTDTCVPAEASATYKVVFDATWSSATHNGVPISPAPHFSPLVGTTHKSSLTLWSVGETASDGMELMAEVGSPDTLSAEINNHITDGTAKTKILGTGINPSPDATSVTFETTSDYPLVTLVSMIAPSPDWFVGVAGLSLCEDNHWVSSKALSLLPYDAGTDSGERFTAGHADTDPQIPISSIVGAPFLASGTLVPLGTFTFTKQ
jgi:hypothetical protein